MTLPPNLQVWWRMNGNPAEAPYKIDDNSGNNINSNAFTSPYNHNSLTPVISNENPPIDDPNDTEYIQSRSLTFLGNWDAADGDFAQFPRPAGQWDNLVGQEGSVGGNPFSLSFWWRAESWNSSAARRAVIVKFGDGWGTGTYRAFSALGGSTRGHFQVEWAEYTAVASSYVRVSYPPNTFGGTAWHHVVFTRSDVQMTNNDNPWKIYIDGEEFATTFVYNSVAPTTLATSGGTDPGYISDNWSTPHGQLADIAMWDVELTSSQVKAIYNASLKGVDDGETITGEAWFAMIERSTDIGDATVQYQAIGAAPLRVK